MSDGVAIPETPVAYEHASHLTLECPKCGHRGSFPSMQKRKSVVEYAGVCEAAVGTGGWCGTVFNVQVTTHVFPA